METYILELLGGAGIFVSTFFYVKFQTGQNAKEIEELKFKVRENETKDAENKTELKVLQSQFEDLKNSLK